MAVALRRQQTVHYQETAFALHLQQAAHYQETVFGERLGHRLKQVLLHLPGHFGHREKTEQVDLHSGHLDLPCPLELSPWVLVHPVLHLGYRLLVLAKYFRFAHEPD